MASSDPDTPPDPRLRVMTVARLREAAGRDAEVMFNESARFYRLPRHLPGHDGFMRLLRAAHASGRPVQVTLSTPHGDAIQSVQDAAAS